jgi:hypothetical protein
MGIVHACCINRSRMEDVLVQRENSQDWLNAQDLDPWKESHLDHMTR